MVVATCIALSVVVVLLGSFPSSADSFSFNLPTSLNFRRNFDTFQVVPSTSSSGTCFQKKPSSSLLSSIEDQTNSVRSQTTTKIRPLHQNWRPVSTTSALDELRPNAIELLGVRHVLFKDGETDEWKCLDDKCSHRFAPLSEGRIVKKACSSSSSSETKNCIQCAYHGWEFDGEGSCTHIPQLEESKKVQVSPVQSYPVQVQVGIVWVWSDPATAVFSSSVPLPLSPLLKRQHEKYGDDSPFMRDLPYGMELLGENLLDLAHLPFSHHSVGSLARDLGGPLSLRMLSGTEKEADAEWEMNQGDYSNNVTILPMFQAEVLNAPKNDPIYAGFPLPVPEDATTTISFYDPFHVRYRRERMPGAAFHVELFMAPTSAGKSRVFLFNVAEAVLPPLPVTAEKQEKPTLKSRLSALSPVTLKQKLQKKIISKVFAPGSVNVHMINHQIFDGDGIFLNKQGDRMRRSDLTYTDYATPSTADILLNAYRRYLDRAATKAGEIGHSAASSSVAQSGDGQYVDNDNRRLLLDRYESHTAKCSICSKALAKSNRWHRRWDIVQTGLVGAAGASSTACATTIVTSVLGVSVPTILSPIFGVAFLSTSLGAVVANRKKKKLDKTIQQFYFEDYVHAEKD